MISGDLASLVHAAHEGGEVVQHLRMLVVELHRGLEVLATAAAAAEQAQALLEHHAGVDGHVVLGDAEQRHGASG